MKIQFISEHFESLKGLLQTRLADGFVGEGHGDMHLGNIAVEEGRFIIELKDGGDFAGTISYSGLEPRWSATIGIMVPKRFWGTGIGKGY